METVIYVFNRESIRASAFTLWPFQKKNQLTYVDNLAKFEN